MATTVVAPVGNQITLAQKYLDMLDEVYSRESLTSVFEMPEDLVRWQGAKTVNLFELNPVALANYSRNAGFVPGDADGSWNPYTIEIDRGRSFLVDSMDDEETMGLAFGRLLGEFERRFVVPELDAYRFAKIAGTAGVTSVTETISTAAAAIAAIDLATANLDDAEVPYEGRILFVNPTFYRYLKGGIERRVMNGDRNIDYNVEYYNDMRIISVPSARFNTAVTLNAPTASSGAGGYTATGNTINFMIVHPDAIMGVVKHKIPNIFSPAENQEADGWKLNYRIYHDVWVKKNKVKGVYVNAPA